MDYTGDWSNTEYDGKWISTESIPSSAFTYTTQAPGWVWYDEISNTLEPLEEPKKEPKNHLTELEELFEI